MTFCAGANSFQLLAVNRLRSPVKLSATMAISSRARRLTSVLVFCATHIAYAGASAAQFALNAGLFKKLMTPSNFVGHDFACGSMTTSNVVPSAACSNNVCPTGRPIQFSLLPKGYDFSCSVHTYIWDFGDGTPVSTSPTPTHTFYLGGPFRVTATIKNVATGQVFTTSPDAMLITAKYGANGGPCPSMDFTTFGIDIENPNECAPSEICPPRQSIGFTVRPVAYDFACSQHSFEWNFGDGTKETGGSNIRHSFPPASTFADQHLVTVRVSNPQTPIGVTKELYVQVGRGTPSTCPAMTFENVQPALRSLAECPVNFCPANTSIDLTLLGADYDFNCAQHTFTWNFGDGATADGGNTIQHSFPSVGGTYAIKVEIANAQQTFTTAALPLHVRPCEATAALPSRVPFGPLGAPYYLPLNAQATGFKLTAGALPPGLTLTDTAIEGSPLVAGTYKFTLTATSGSTCTASADYEMAVGLLSRRHAVRP